MKERVLAARRPHPLHTLVRRLDEHGCRTVVHHPPHLGVGRQRRLLETTHNIPRTQHRRRRRRQRYDKSRQ